jgi:hypothetical protein
MYCSGGLPLVKTAFFACAPKRYRSTEAVQVYAHDLSYLQKSIK